MKTEKVDKRYVIRLTESEAEVLEKRFALSGMSSVSAYLRQQVVNGIYLEYDHEELKKNTAGGYACGEQRQSDCTQSEFHKPYLQTGTL